MVLLEALPLIPFPSSVQAGDGSVPLGSVRVEGHPETDVLFRDDLAARLGAGTLGKDGCDEGTTDDGIADDSTVIVLTIDPDAVRTPGGYSLDAADTTIWIAGHDAAGLYYGTRTLLQLLRREGGGEEEERWVVPELRIDDAPRFSYRGVMLDIARHFFGVDDVKRFIDRAADLKFNHLHLHLTDDQGWRIQIDSWPLLAARGGASDASGGSGGFFTKDDYRAIVAYAAARHMTVVPEIDLPGHTHAVGVGYPELVEPPTISAKTIAESELLHQRLPEHGVPYAGWAVGHSSVRIHDERTYDLILDVLTEVAELTPGPYLHLGGDECLGTSAEDFALFFERVGRIATSTGKIPVAWHEAGAVDGIAAGMVGQYWAGAVPTGAHAAHVAHFVERGGALILSPSDRAYLDMKPRADFPLGLAWAGLVPLRTAYDWEPTAVLDGVPESAIVGIEAPLWTETVSTLAEADQLVFPRIAAHAEIGWSAPGSTHAHPGVRTWESFRARVAGLIPAWEASGIGVDRAALDEADTPADTGKNAETAPATSTPDPDLVIATTPAPAPTGETA